MPTFNLRILRIISKAARTPLRLDADAGTNCRLLWENAYWATVNNGIDARAFDEQKT